jgi:hypothetical protein
MQVEFANELKDRLDPNRTGLQVGATYVPTNQLLRDYLNRPYGNAYDFNQVDRIEDVF